MKLGLDKLEVGILFKQSERWVCPGHLQVSINYSCGWGSAGRILKTSLLKSLARVHSLASQTSLGQHYIVEKTLQKWWQAGRLLMEMRPPSQLKMPG